jgi:glutathione reductase (NADPH)
MRYERDTRYDFDLFVIGGGSGGVRAARVSANHGARVALAECSRLGGTCVNVGCIPKKLFSYGSHYSHDFEDARAYGWDLPSSTELGRVDWSRLIRNKDAEIERLNGVYQRILEKAGVRIFHARAELVDAHTLRVGDEQTFTAKYILIAVGSRSNPLADMPGFAHCIMSDDCFYLKHLPRSVLVVGGGYIGTEFAGIFHGYGSKVTQIHRGELFLRGFDEDIRLFVAQQMRKDGIDLRFKCSLKAVEAIPDASAPDGRVLRAHLTDGSELVVDQVLLAVGRHPNTEGLGLEHAGIDTDPRRGHIIVDEYSRTNVEHIYAVGDVTNRMNLTPVAIAEGHCFADTIFGGRARAPSYDMVPTAVFSVPPVGAVGLTEQKARELDKEQGGSGIDIYRSVFRPLKHTLTKRERQTLMKLVVDRKTQRVLGCHLVDDAAPEVIQAVAIALKMGATKADFDNVIGVHPTSAEELVTLREKTMESK